MVEELYGVPIAGLVIGLTEAVKRYVPLPSQYLPLFNVVISLTLMIAATLELNPGDPNALAKGVVWGLVVSLGSMGLYSSSKATIGR